MRLRGIREEENWMVDVVLKLVGMGGLDEIRGEGGGLCVDVVLCVCGCV